MLCFLEGHYELAGTGEADVILLVFALLVLLVDIDSAGDDVVVPDVEDTLLFNSRLALVILKFSIYKEIKIIHCIYIKTA